jgi:hypothetical protein
MQHLLENTWVILFWRNSYWSTRCPLLLTQYSTRTAVFRNDREHNSITWRHLIKYLSELFCYLFQTFFSIERSISSNNCTTQHSFLVLGMHALELCPNGKHICTFKMGEFQYCIFWCILHLGFTYCVTKSPSHKHSAPPSCLHNVCHLPTSHPATAACNCCSSLFFFHFRSSVFYCLLLDSMEWYGLDWSGSG